MQFSSQEHEILREVCDSFVGPVVKLDEDHDYWNGKLSDLNISEKVEQSAAKLPEEDIKDLKRLLKILTKKELGLTWAGPLKPFSQLNQKQREKLFYRWSKSSVNDLRKAFNVFRKLSTFIYYSASPEEIPHVHQKIGYPGPISEGPDQITEIHHEQVAEGETLTCKYLIIGSGSGGGLAAGMLAEAGKDVILVEKGSFLNEQDLNQKEWDMISHLYDRGGALATKDAGVTVFAGSCLGGGTTVNWNGSFGTPEYILNEWASEHDLPHVVSAEYQASHEAVNKIFNVNADNSDHNAQNQRLWDGSVKLGKSPKLIKRNVRNCNEAGTKHCGYCGMGCKNGCKQGTLTTTIGTASANGARIFCDAEIRKLTLSGSRATGAVGTQMVNGKPVRFSVKAENVIVACGAIHTPALLMRSGIRHTELGKNLFFHPTVAVAAKYREYIEPWNGAMMTTLVADALRLDGNYGYWIETPPVHPGVMGMTLPWVSREQHKEDFTMARNCGAFIVLTRDKYGGKVSIDKNGDAAINYKMHSYDLNHSLKGMVEAAEIHLAAGAEEVLFPHRTRKAVSTDMPEKERNKLYKSMTAWRWRPNDYILYSAHQMSTCRMGGDSKKHPVAPDGSLYGYSNIYVADGSALPSCPGINPMISIMTQSHYTIKTIIDG